MTASATAFGQAANDNRAVLVGYLPAGFPSYDGCIAGLRAMIDAGVDVVEIGLPYSDPVIDGPTIQAAAEQALRKGTRTADVLRTVEAIASTGTPSLVMSYWNPILRYGVDAFARDLAAAGGAGIITPDLIPDEAADWIAASDAHDLERIFLVAPSSTPARVASTVSACRGWVYAASTMGVTGARESTSSAAPALVERTRAARPDLPVGVGLGVSNGGQAAEVAAYADAVIVGSAFVRCGLDTTDEQAAAKALAALAADLAAGVRR